MHLLHGASSAHTSTCSALRKLSPPVGLCVSASHQTRLYHSKQAIRRMLPREKTVSAAHRAHTHCFGCRKKALPLPSVVLASPQKTKCARHPSVVMMSVLLCLVLSVILPPLPVLHLQACLSAWVEQVISVKVKKKTTCWVQIEITITEHILFLELKKKELDAFFKRHQSGKRGHRSQVPKTKVLHWDHDRKFAWRLSWVTERKIYLIWPSKHRGAHYFHFLQLTLSLSDSCLFSKLPSTALILPLIIEYYWETLLADLLVDLFIWLLGQPRHLRSC